MTAQFTLPPWPKLGRYKGGKGRPAPSAPRQTLAPLPSVAAPLATINRNGDPPEQILDRVAAVLADVTISDDVRRHFVVWHHHLMEKLHVRA